jgi:hypothetical protein
VRKLLARLNPDQRRRYEKACETAPRHRNGRLYDGMKAQIAERILLEDALKLREVGPGLSQEGSHE